MPDQDYAFPTFYSVDEIRSAIDGAGDRFFHPDEMWMFRCRVGEDLYGGRFFVTSESDSRGPRRYTVRMVYRFTDTGKPALKAVGGQGRFASRSGANAAARTYGEQTAESYLTGLVTGNL